MPRHLDWGCRSGWRVSVCYYWMDANLIIAIPWCLGLCGKSFGARMVFSRSSLTHLILLGLPTVLQYCHSTFSNQRVFGLEHERATTFPQPFPSTIFHQHPPFKLALAACFNCVDANTNPAILDDWHCVARALDYEWLSVPAFNDAFDGLSTLGTPRPIIYSSDIRSIPRRVFICSNHHHLLLSSSVLRDAHSVGQSFYSSANVYSSLFCISDSCLVSLFGHFDNQSSVLTASHSAPR